MNICRISIGFPPRRCGWSNHAFYLSQYQALNGDNVFVLQPYMEDTYKGLMRIIRIKLNDINRSQNRVLFCMRALSKCIKIHRKEHLDIIHCHGDAFEAFFLGLLGRCSKLPVVLTIHSSLNNKWLYKTWAPFLFSFISVFIVVSENIKNDLISLGIHTEKINVISSGIEYETFARKDVESRINIRKKLGIPLNTIVIISVGRLQPVKGFTYLIDAIKIMSNRNELLAIIVGDGPEQSELQAKGEGLKILFVGEKSREDVAEFLHSADIFALPSIDVSGHAEGTPTSVMEAMAAGLPIVTTDSGGTKYLINNGENGFIVKQKDPEELAKAILKLLDNPELREKISKTNQIAAKEKDWSIIAQKVYQVYQKTMKNKTD